MFFFSFSIFSPFAIHITLSLFETSYKLSPAILYRNIKPVLYYHRLKECVSVWFYAVFDREMKKKERNPIDSQKLVRRKLHVDRNERFNIFAYRLRFACPTTSGKVLAFQLSAPEHNDSQ